MTIQALVNLRIRSVDIVVEVRAGEMVELPLETVDTLLQKIPDKIRIIRPGFIVTWKSPPFGVCEGRVSEVKADVVVINEHSVTKGRAEIPATWVTKIEEAVG